MARILQIRRGTAQQNDNFTGLSGEITFDTDTKTLRIHDGETLGGFKIARADQISATGGGETTFDINDVSDDFWTGLFSRMLPKTINYIEGHPMMFGISAHLEYIFNLASAALFAQPILVCVVADAGYAVGDEVYSFGVGENPVMSPNLYRDSYGVHARLFMGGEQFWVPNRNTGIKTNISADNWRIKFRLYY